MTSTDKYWFVSYVRSCQEKKAAQALASMGVEYYLPVQRVPRKWSDRIKIVEQLVLPRYIFIHTTLADRMAPVIAIPYLTRYISNGPYNPVIIRDSEMETFMNMVSFGQGRVSMSSEPLAPGDKVRAVSGPLKGSEFELLKVSGTRCLGVRLGPLGTATIDLSVADVTLIKED